MRLTTIAVVVLCLATAHDACAQGSKSKSKSKKGTKSAAAVSAEMKDFMGYFNGDGKKTDAALEKYRAKDADVSDMSGELSVADAKILKAEKTKDGEDRYTMFARTGLAERTFLITWKDKKIQKIKQLSMQIP